MAVAGLHNVSVLDSSFLRDSHSQSSRRRGDRGRGSTRSSSLLQMWREIEDEHAVSQTHGSPGEGLLQQRSDRFMDNLSQANMPDSHDREQRHILEDAVLGENECETWSQSQSQNGSHYEQEESNNSSCENSSEFGEVERERVRQIFREWMNSGASDDASNISRRDNRARAEWLGETEQERVRVIREWVQMSSQQRGISSGDNREEQPAEIGTQIERVRDVFIVNQSEGQAEQLRRGIRKLCGRQVLLDMLKKAERERQKEVQELLEHHVVSNFSHRNRIQALLRGRFLRNDILIDNNRPTSVAESELGLLRQKQTVSGLREGFFSRKDGFCCSQVTSSTSDISYNSDVDANANEQAEASSSQVVPIVYPEQPEPINHGGKGDRLGSTGGPSCLQGTTSENLDWQDSDSNAHIERGQQLLWPIDSKDWQSSSSVDTERREGTGQNADELPAEYTDNGSMQQSLQTGDGTHSNMQDFTEVHDEQFELGDISNDDNSLANYSNHIEDNIADDVNWNDSTALEVELQGEVVENEGNNWQQTNVEWRNSIVESMDDNQLNEWPQEILGNEGEENSHMQEAPAMWQEDGGFQEAVENWLGGPSDHEGAPVGRIHGFYFPDDDNVYSVELRELLSRRSVSNLLGSSFRESLNQLIQSYVERQGHAQVEWELQETTPSAASVEQELEQQSVDRIIAQGEAVNHPLDLPSPPTPPQTLWERQSRHDNWTQNDVNNQRLGIEWDIINDLRIDMARLQQRMNNMQRMLEACMDMQLELQRSIRQEVSAALNRSTGSSGIHDYESPDDKSKWECVRKGLCCMCCESNIDSLLYRCGHMCTCSKCANELFRSRRKCPMCQAPVVEVIRAYSIL
ncbi:hypothetical protein L6164_022043 [Bauhinia variegata]|uniref:Uncharacterized protein n=1 Tax=Bauhinia variegata TaxID=167791 RepID=A0ACB9MFB4_BAUVA|nr:hypothetical protein L6164_022043 [Bauhinia variegata]